MIRRLSLVVALTLVPFALAQGALIHFLSTGANPHYPFELWLRNESKAPSTVRVDDIDARLAPVTPDLGRVSNAYLVFAPGARTVTLPPEGNNVTFPFRLAADAAAPRGVYTLEADFPGDSIWDNPPGFNPVTDYPLAYTPDLQVPQTYRLGQRFLFLGEGAKCYRLGERTLEHCQLYGHMFTLIRYRDKTAYFRVEGVSQLVSLEFSAGDTFRL